MSYEATIKTQSEHINISTDDARVWMFTHVIGGYARARMTASKARELAHALLDAAADLEPEIVGGTVDLRAEPVTGVMA